MTEDEAKTKWCPAIRIGAESETSYACTNREERLGERPQPEASRCIASACMAWRGKETRGFEMKAEAEFRRTGIRLKPEGQDVEGFCGLAGAAR